MTMFASPIRAAARRRRARPTVPAVYRTKYGSYNADYVNPMVAARDTTPKRVTR